jgi:hypothetical protein
MNLPIPNPVALKAALIKYLIMLLVGLVSLISAGVFGYGLGKDHEIAAHAEETTKLQKERDDANERANDASSGYEKILAYMDSQQKLNEKRWRNELNKPAYTNCKPSDDGLLQLNEQINAANNSRKLDGAMPSDSSPGIRGNNGRPNAGAQGPDFRLW